VSKIETPLLSPAAAASNIWILVAAERSSTIEILQWVSFGRHLISVFSEESAAAAAAAENYDYVHLLEFELLTVNGYILSVTS
jgi:hypothetical protein